MQRTQTFYAFVSFFFCLFLQTLKCILSALYTHTVCSVCTDPHQWIYSSLMLEWQWMAQAIWWIVHLVQVLFHPRPPLFTTPTIFNEFSLSLLVVTHIVLLLLSSNKDRTFHECHKYRHIDVCSILHTICNVDNYIITTQIQN